MFIGYWYHKLVLPALFVAVRLPLDIDPSFRNSSLDLLDFWLISLAISFVAFLQNI